MFKYKIFISNIKYYYNINIIINININIKILIFLLNKNLCFIKLNILYE